LKIKSKKNAIIHIIVVPRANAIQIITNTNSIKNQTIATTKNTSITIMISKIGGISASAAIRIPSHNLGENTNQN
jgi:hypothetical protein